MADIARFEADTNTLTVAGRRLVFHCHHYNVLLQRTVEDALGPEGAREVQQAAAAESSRVMLEGLFAAEKCEGFEARMVRAAEVFGSLGFGAASVGGVGPLGGEVRLSTSHYAIGWRSKLGPAARPVCHFAAGFFRGAFCVAAGLPPERVRSVEGSCAAQGQGACVVQIEVL